MLKLNTSQWLGVMSGTWLLIGTAMVASGHGSLAWLPVICAVVQNTGSMVSRVLENSVIRAQVEGEVELVKTGQGARPRVGFLHCPFCGGRRAGGANVTLYSHYMRCLDCGAQGPSESSLDEAGAAWNRRVGS